MGKLRDGVEDYSRVLRRLQALCRYARRLPRAWSITEEISFPEQNPRHQSAQSDVWFGRLGQTEVAVKVIRVRLDTMTKAEKGKLSHFYYLLSRANAHACRHTTLKLPLGGGCTTQILLRYWVLPTSELILVS